MATSTLTTLDPILEDVYLGPLTEQFYSHTPLYDRIEKVTAKHRFAGRRFVLGHHVSRAQNYGYRPENVALPTAQGPETDTTTVGLAYGYGQIKLTGQLIAATKGGRRAFADALELHMKDAKEGLGFHTARHTIFGAGTGVLAYANGAGSATTSLVVDNPGTEFLEAGMYIDIYTSAGSLEVENVRISSVDDSTNTVTLASASTWSDNSYVYLHGERNAVLMGLAGIVDDGTLAATFQGKTRSTDTWLKCNVLSNSGVNRAVTLRLVDDGALEGKKNIKSGGALPSAIYSKTVIAQNYAELVRVDRRFSPQEMTLKNGWTALKVTVPGATLPWFMEDMCRPNSIYMVRESDLMMAELEPLSWWKPDGNIVRPATDGTDAIQATLRVYHQLAASRCNTHTLIKDVTE